MVWISVNTPERKVAVSAVAVLIWKATWIRAREASLYRKISFCGICFCNMKYWRPINIHTGQDHDATKTWMKRQVFVDLRNAITRTQQGNKACSKA